MSSTVRASGPSRAAVPPLEKVDDLTSVEFLRRYQAPRFRKKSSPASAAIASAAPVTSIHSGCVSEEAAGAATGVCFAATGAGAGNCGGLIGVRVSPRLERAWGELMTRELSRRHPHP